MSDHINEMRGCVMCIGIIEVTRKEAVRLASGTENVLNYNNEML